MNKETKQNANKMKKLLLLLLCVPLIGLGQTEYKKIYYENGQLKSEGNYVDGKKDGLWKSYFDNDELLKYSPYSYKENQIQLKTETYYKNDKYNGLMKEYWPDGGLMKEASYKEDIPIVIKIYHPISGKLWSESRYKDGEIIYKKCFDEAGNEIRC